VLNPRHERQLLVFRLQGGEAIRSVFKGNGKRSFGLHISLVCALIAPSSDAPARTKNKRPDMI
jgi:hypothetical protein